MTSNQFLEEYPLYRKLKYASDDDKQAPYLNHLLSSPFHMDCEVCQAERTFHRLGGSTAWQGDSFNSTGIVSSINLSARIEFLNYRCAACQKFTRTFTIFIDYLNSKVQKLGQYPAWEIKVNKDTSKALGDYNSLFRKGLVCESQGYGIAAYSYYRRIVETQIDTLLDEIAQFLSGSDRTEYEAVLARIRNETIAAKKIELAKALLPDSLRPNGLNPLDALYVALSKGIHQLSDEDCLELASAVRSSLVYLIKRTAESKRASDDYISDVQKILDHNRGQG